ncbi:hypothetical protein C0991_000856 [Blastosporella zonata]|nr:hypothetical protein C0991_000856 [Blastosporella zonata]
MEFCYLVCLPVLDKDNLAKIDSCVANFHFTHTIFEDIGVCPGGISLPRQHSLVHYWHLIQEFGAPNGLCSSITELAHIKAVKEPWRRSNRYNALGQMLITNQRLSKLAACHVNFRSQGMLGHLGPGPPVTAPAGDKDDNEGGADNGQAICGEVVLSQKPIPSLPVDIEHLADYLGILLLSSLISHYLHQHEHPDFTGILNNIPIQDYPAPAGRICIYPSAVATFFAPSDKSGVHGMFREHIWAISSWRGGSE